MNIQKLRSPTIAFLLSLLQPCPMHSYPSPCIAVRCVHCPFHRPPPPTFLPYSALLYATLPCPTLQHARFCHIVVPSALPSTLSCAMPFTLGYCSSRRANHSVSSLSTLSLPWTAHSLPSSCSHLTFTRLSRCLGHAVVFVKKLFVITTAGYV